MSRKPFAPEAQPNLSELSVLNWLALPLLPGDREASWLILGSRWECFHFLLPGGLLSPDFED